MKFYSCIMEEESSLKEKTPLRLLREESGLTRPQVKAHIGISERMQADWESGKSMPSAQHLASLARLYKKSLKDIYAAVGIDVTDIPDERR